MTAYETIPHPSSSNRAMLHFYLAHERQPPTWLELAKRFLPKWMRLAVLGVAAFALVEYVGTDAFGTGILLFYAGYVFGVIVKDVVEIHKLLTTWPVLAYIIDWTRVRGLLGEGDVQREQ